MSDQLTQLRHQIDTIDTQLIKLLSKRQQIVHQIGAYKKAHHLPALAPDRKATMLEARTKQAKLHQLSPEFIRKLFTLIHDHCVKLQESPDS